MPNYAIIDTETTGIGKFDRVIEIAIVVLDSESLQPVDEFDSLVNPDRDVGRVDIHGITPAMLSSAPRFDEVVAGIARRLSGAVLVAHNLAFDVRMIRNEMRRINTDFDPGKGYCTLRMTGSKLGLVAAELGIGLENHHRALCDARATASVFKCIFGESTGKVPAVIRSGDLPPFQRTLRREATGWIPSMPLLRQMIEKARIPSSDVRFAEYFDVLDWTLADGVISDDELVVLDDVRRSLGLSESELGSMHEAYMQSLLAAIHRDGRVTEEEAAMYGRVAASLGFRDREIKPTSLLPDRGIPNLRPGARVCFTGSAIGRDGLPIERVRLEQIAAACGLQPVERVTKKLCDLLVAENAETRSGKGKMAAQYGIPIMTVHEFLMHVDA